MRLFIAIDLPKEIKDYLYELQKEIISKINTREIKIKWVHKKNIHCTLKFIKYFPEDKLDYLKSTGKKLGRPTGSKDKKRRRKSGYLLRYQIKK